MHGYRKWYRCESVHRSDLLRQRSKRQLRRRKQRNRHCPAVGRNCSLHLCVEHRAGTNGRHRNQLGGRNLFRYCNGLLGHQHHPNGHHHATHCFGSQHQQHQYCVCRRNRHGHGNGNGRHRAVHVCLEYGPRANYSYGNGLNVRILPSYGNRRQGLHRNAQRGSNLGSGTPGGSIYHHARHLQHNVQRSGTSKRFRRNGSLHVQLVQRPNHRQYFQCLIQHLCRNGYGRQRMQLPGHWH